MKFEKRKLIIEIEKRAIDKKTGHISFQFQIGPFKKTMGTTIGTALRRTLLSLPKTVTITSVCGKFQHSNCLREDLFELSLNFQKINIKSSFSPYLGTGRIKKNGPAIITAQDLKLEEGLEIVNPYQYICSINEGCSVDMIVMISSPTISQSLSLLDPSSNFIKSRSEAIRDRQKNIFPITAEKSEIFIKSVEKSIQNSIILNSIKSTSSFSSKIEKPEIKLIKKTKSLASELPILKKKGNQLRIVGPQKLPFDIIMVDPIYSAIQSCGFEISQTIKSSVIEYDELIKQGIAQTEEFLRFVVISRGTIEPASAIQTAINEIKDTLSIIEPLNHVFLNQRKIILGLRDSKKKIQTSITRKNISTSYLSQVLFKLDISTLNLPIHLELVLRREGFVNLENLRTTPLEFLRAIGLKENEIKVIQKSLNNLEIPNNIDQELIWDLIPKTIPKS